MGVRVETTIKMSGGSSFVFRVDEYPEATKWWYDSDGSYRIEKVIKEDEANGTEYDEEVVAEYPKERVFRVYRYDENAEKSKPMAEKEDDDDE